MLGTAPCIVPASIWFYMGHTFRRFHNVKELKQEDEPYGLQYLLFFLELFFAITVGFMISFKAKKELAKILKRQEEAKKLNEEHPFKSDDAVVV